MITVTAASESTGVSDNASGKPILITTSVRIAFRKAFPTAQKIRNAELNKAIAAIFSASKTAERFRPYNKHSAYVSGTMGVVRPAGGGRFIAIIGNDSVRIIDFKGSPPTLDLPEESADESSGLTDAAVTELQNAMHG